MFRKNNGFSLTVLAIAIAVIIIITATAVLSIKNVNKDRKISEFMSDLAEVKQYLIEYTSHNNSLPVLISGDEDVESIFLTRLSSGESHLDQIDSSDFGKYFRVDLTKLGKIHLVDENRGYIFNEGTLNVYVLNPAEYEGSKYFALTSYLTGKSTSTDQTKKFEINIAGNPITWATKADILVTIPNIPIDSTQNWTFQWLEGSQTIEDFRNSSTVNFFSYGDTITFTKNGIYTIYVENTNGDVDLRKVVITKIDEIPPVVTVDDGEIKIDDAETGVRVIKYKIKETKDFNLDQANREAHSEYYTQISEADIEQSKHLENVLTWIDGYLGAAHDAPTGDTIDLYFSKYKKYREQYMIYDRVLISADSTSGEISNARAAIENLNSSYPQFAFNNTPFPDDEHNIVLYVEDEAGNPTVYAAVSRKELEKIEYLQDSKATLTEAKIIINNNSLYTNNRNVNVFMQAPHAAYYFLTEERGATPVWKDYSVNTVPFELSAESGDKIIYAFFKDYSGKIISTYARIGLNVERLMPITDTIYVKLFSNGTLEFSNNDDSVGYDYRYTIGRNDLYNGDNLEPWHAQKNLVTNVDFANEIVPSNTAFWFYDLPNLVSFNHLSRLNTSRVQNMYWMFAASTGIQSLDLSSFDTSKVVDMSFMFGGATCKMNNGSRATNTQVKMGLTSVNLDGFDTKNVTDMRCMFFNCGNIVTLDLSDFDTRNVTNMGDMFNGPNDSSSKLESIILGSRFDTSKVTHLNNFVCDCVKLESIDVSTFNTANVNNMSFMFSNCPNLKSINVSNFDTSNVIYMNSMFTSCVKLTTLDLTSFNTSKVTDMRWMFANDNNLTTIYVSNNFTTGAVTADTEMFVNCNNIKGEKGTTYSSGYIGKSRAIIDNAPTTKGYFTDGRPNLWVNNQQVDYIESTGTQYIDTGIIANDVSLLKVRFSLNNNQTNHNGIVGGGWSSNNVTFQILYNYLTQQTNVKYGSKTISFNNDELTHDAELSPNMVKLDSNEESHSSTISDNRTVVIFARRQDNNGAGIQESSNCKIYSCQIYKNGDLVRDFIPVYNTFLNEAGLYDRVNGIFYKNLGTGTFSYPSN